VNKSITGVGETYLCLLRWKGNQVKDLNDLVAVIGEQYFTRNRALGWSAYTQKQKRVMSLEKDLSMAVKSDS